MIHTPSDKGEMAVQELQQLRAQQGNASASQPSDSNQKADVSFGDVLDIVNPLQHIPGVASVYREVTGDEISGHAQVMGSTLYGGPIGMLGGAMAAAMTEESGRSMPETLAAAFTGESGTAAETQTRRTAAADAAPRDGRTGASGTSSADTTDTADTAATAAAGKADSGGARAATAALPAGINSVLPPAPTPGDSTAGNAGAAGHGADTTAGADAAAATARRGSTGGDVLQGKDALAAFARDKQNLAGQAAAESAAQQNNAASARADGADPGAAGGERGRGRRDAGTSAGERAAALNQQQDFMKLRESDYATAAEVRARTQNLDKLQAAAANEVSPRVDNNASAVHDSRGASGHADADSGKAANGNAAGVPGDFASRMKEALAKYRALHDNE